MPTVPASGLTPGVTIQLTGWQKLWDPTKSPWLELRPPARLRVISVVAMATGAAEDVTPYALVLSAPDGTRIDLDVADGSVLMNTVSP